MMDQLEEPAVADLPPSCKLVYLILRESGWMSTPELISWADLPERTVRRAITELRNQGVLQERYRLDDTRVVEFRVIDEEMYAKTA